MKKTLGPKKVNDFESNLAELKQVLSVDTLLYDIKQDAALEALDVFETSARNKITDLEKALEESDDEVNAKDRKITELENQVEELEEKLEKLEEVDGAIVIKLDNMVLRDKLETFITTHIYPYYNEQVANLTI